MSEKEEDQPKGEASGEAPPQKPGEEVPPFSPDRELITYMERSQKPPATKTRR